MREKKRERERKRTGKAEKEKRHKTHYIRCVHTTSRCQLCLSHGHGANKLHEIKNKHTSNIHLSVSTTGAANPVKALASAQRLWCQCHGLA